MISITTDTLKKILILSLMIGFQYSCDQDVSISPPEEEIPRAFLYVKSEPSGFAIYLNNKNTGRITPGLVPYLEDGKYNITLKKKYFKDTTTTISLNQFDTSIVNIDYFLNPSMFGKINFTSVPSNASVILNDSLTNLKTPVQINGFLPGKYQVKFRYYNYRDSKIDVIVESNKTASAYASLRDTSTWIDFQQSNSEIQSVLLTSIIVDDQNVKWMGSFDKGLIKFNENEFINFNTGNSVIPSNQVNCLNIDNSNKIWIGTNNGLAVYNSGSWQIFNTNNSELPNNNINSISFDNAGNAWIGTNNGFVKCNGNTWTVYNYSSSRVQYLWVTSMAPDNQNNIWIGSNNFGIIKFDQNVFTEYIDTVYDYLTNRISFIETDNQNNIWFGQLISGSSRGGVSIFNGNSFDNIYIGTSNNKINSIYAYGESKWVCTSEGLAYYDENNSSVFFNTLNTLISNDNVTGITIDQNGIYWVTTFGGGLNKFKF